MSPRKGTALLNVAKRGPAKRNPRLEAAELEERADRLLRTAATINAQALRLYMQAARLRDRHGLD